MDELAAREALAALIADRREDYASLSRLLGRNPAYIQQYVKRGTPRRLAETDRATLARYFGVEESLLGGPPPRPRTDMVQVPRRALGASAGPGAMADEEGRAAAIGFPPALLRELGVSPSASLSLIRVRGDSMQPTLHDGDDILVDEGDAADHLRDGVYVLRAEGVLLVKRLALHPGGGLSVLSDNQAAAQWTDLDRRSIEIVGRVVWAGRRLR